MSHQFPVPVVVVVPSIPLLFLLLLIGRGDVDLPLRLFVFTLKSPPSIPFPATCSHALIFPTMSLEAKLPFPVSPMSVFPALSTPPRPVPVLYPMPVVCCTYVLTAAAVEVAAEVDADVAGHGTFVVCTYVGMEVCVVCVGGAGVE